MAFYRRRLPHIHLLDHPTFVTFRLHGSLPAGLIFLGDPWSFRKAEALLDRPATGPMWLGDSRVASLVVKSIAESADRLRFDLHAFVVMSNHVHVLLTPHIELIDILHSVKSFTGRYANEILCLRGPFWQQETFDHIVRSAASFRRIVSYIHNNPVKGGLASAPHRFRWSSAWAGLETRPTKESDSK